jgi:drug/metabolite transporter (DMT)-like permease
MRFFRTLSARTIGIASAVITVVIWTGFIIIARATSDPARGAVMTPFDIVFARIVGASLVLLPWGWWLVRRDRANAGAAAPRESSMFGFAPLSLKVTAITGTFGGLLYGVLAYSGFVYAPAAHASVLMPGSLPLWTALLAVLMLGERLTPPRLLGLALIVAGDGLVGGSSLLKAFEGGTVWRGDVLFMVSALCWSFYSILARRFALDAVRATIAITAFAFFTYLPLYALLGSLHLIPSRLMQAPLGDFLFQMVFQGMGSVVISGITFTRMIQYFGPVKATLFTALVPGSSALGAAFFLGEPLSWNLWLGLGLVTLGIVAGVQSVKPKTTKLIATNQVKTGATG